MARGEIIRSRGWLYRQGQGQPGLWGRGPTSRPFSRPGGALGCRPKSAGATESAVATGEAKERSSEEYHASDRTNRTRLNTQPIRRATAEHVACNLPGEPVSLLGKPVNRDSRWSAIGGLSACIGAKRVSTDIDRSRPPDAQLRPYSFRPPHGPGKATSIAFSPSDFSLKVSSPPVLFTPEQHPEIGVNPVASISGPRVKHRTDSGISAHTR